jgi:cytosine/adenosine deaminase-related metal-dependent hydrolase
MSETLIRNATIVAMDEEHGSAPFSGDILIDGATIKAVGGTIAAGPGARIIEGRGKLVMPGLVNAHIPIPARLSFAVATSACRSRSGCSMPIRC